MQIMVEKRKRWHYNISTQRFGFKPQKNYSRFLRVEPFLIYFKFLYTSKSCFFFSDEFL